MKQIDMKTALERTVKGEEVMVLIPGLGDGEFQLMMSYSLQKMLDGYMFFQRDPGDEVQTVVTKEWIK